MGDVYASQARCVIIGSGTRRSKVWNTFEVSRGLVTGAPILSRQVPYAVHMHDGVTSGNALEGA